MTFQWDQAGLNAIEGQIANGFVELGEEMAGQIAQYAPRDRGIYARSIRATTYLDGKVISGRDVKGTGHSSARIRTVVYTTNRLGHILELTGAKPHEIPIHENLARGQFAQRVRIIHHPGMKRQPHFWPGFAATIGRVGSILAGARARRTRINERAL